MFEVLIESDLWFAINKPNGISVHNAEDTSVIQYYKNVSPVHRLDKETSGILLLSRDSSMTAKLQTSLKTSHKKYACVCRKPFPDEFGIWTYPLSEKAQGRNSPAGPRHEQKLCRSIWSQKMKNGYFSMLEVEIETGRTHQIRRHALLSGHPIVGDLRYGDKKYNERISSIYGIDRMYLHAVSLEFEIDGEIISINTKIPEEFLVLFAENSPVNSL